MFQSIRNRAILIYLIIFVIIIGSLSYTFSESATNEMRALIIDNSEEITRLQAEIIGNNLELHISTLEQLASMNTLINGKIDRFTQTSKKYTSSEKFIFDHIFFIDLEGNSYKQDGTIGNVTDREYFYKITEHELDYYVSQPFIGRFLKVPIVAILVPVKDGDKQIGALGGSIKIESLSKSFNSVKLLTESYGWIIDRQGNIISHPNFEYDNYINIRDLPKYGYSDEANVIQKLLINNHGSATFENNGEKHIMTFIKIPYSGGWKLGITSKESDIYSPANIIKKIVVTRGLLLLVIGLILTTFITYSLLKPIETLTHSAKVSQPFNASLTGLQKNTEMMTLVKTYNSMHSAIETYTTQLEDLVEERTEELRVANKKLTTLATRDALTGIYNRHQLYIEINDLIESVTANHTDTFSLCFIDINNFKYYNDTFGHDVGDEILIKISGHMASFVRSEDIIGRYGGDEFIILLPSIKESQLQALIERLRHSVESLIHEGYLESLLGEKVQIPKGKEISLSIGYSIYSSPSNRTADDLIKSADAKMYEMKRNMKDQ